MDALWTLLWNTQDWPLGLVIGGSLWWVALDAAHVLSQALVIGTIALVDLRLLGLGFRNASVSELSARILPWTWVGFGGAAATGALLFVIRSTCTWSTPASS